MVVFFEIVWLMFVVAVVVMALCAIPYALWTKSSCIFFRLVDKSGIPIANQKVYAVYQQTAYANTFAGGYGGDNVFQRSAIGTYGGLHYIGETDDNGIFKKRKVWLKYWGLCFRSDKQELIVMLHLFANEGKFADTPRDLELDFERSIMDPRWFINNHG